MTIIPGEPPAVATLGVLSDDEDRTRLRLINQLRAAQLFSTQQEGFYEGSRRVRDLGIAIPPHLRDVEAVAAWPEIVVDVMHERMDWLGWHTDDDLGLGSVFRENHLGIGVGQAAHDSLICGPGFLLAGTGQDGEPEVLVTPESPSRTTATWSPRLRRNVDALIETYDERGALAGWQLYLPDQTITVRRDRGRLVVVRRDQHGRGRVPVVTLPNRPRASRPMGRSEITRAVRSLTESGMRTLLGMEITREFYAAPQRYLMGADESMFMDLDGVRKSNWDVVTGKVLALPRDGDDNVPVVGQFASASPQPYSDVLRTYAQMVSAASGVPATHLGFTTDNPASADAIREANSRLDKRAILRCHQYDMGLVELGEVCVLWRDGELPEPGSIRSRWSDPSTPTPAAAADRAQKLIAAGVLPPDSDVTLEQLGFSPVDIARLKADRLRSAGRAGIASLGQAAAGARTDPEVADLTGARGAGAV